MPIPDAIARAISGVFSTMELNSSARNTPPAIAWLNWSMALPIWLLVAPDRAASRCRLVESLRTSAVPRPRSDAAPDNPLKRPTASAIATPLALAALPSSAHALLESVMLSTDASTCAFSLLVWSAASIACLTPKSAAIGPAARAASAVMLDSVPRSPLLARWAASPNPSI